MEKLRVLVVDDSIVFRSQIKAALESTDGVEVVGVASNGKIALEKMAQTHVDLVTLDMEMPEMDGLQTLIQLQAKKYNAKVIVFSAQTARGADKALEALTHGASDVVRKPSGGTATLEGALQEIKNELIPKVCQFIHLPRAGAVPPAREKIVARPSLVKTNGYPRVNLELLKPAAIVVGSSTGGPDALEKVFANFAKPIACPILIAQHMPPVFTASLAKRLENISGLPAAEGRQWEPIKSGRIYIAPGDFHMTIANHEGALRIKLDQGPQRNSVRPAVDSLFESAAALFGKRLAGIILTGMGEDGKLGCEAIKTAGGGVMIQSEESCIVFGMPGAVFQCGAYDKIGNLQEIKSVMERMAK